MKVKVESEKVGLKLNIQKAKIMASSPITSWEIDGETVSDFIFFNVICQKDCLLGNDTLSTLKDYYFFSSIQFSHSVVSDCDPMNHSTPGLPVHH